MSYFDPEYPTVVTYGEYLEPNPGPWWHWVWFIAFLLVSFLAMKVAVHGW